MSKRAEEVQASAILPESIISYAKDHAVLSGLVYREGVKYGYEQAENDLALTPEDVVVLVNLYEYGKANGWTAEDVIRRFNEQRKK